MILCFSGTGNSLQAARLLGEHLSLEVVSLPLDPSHEEAVAAADTIVWVCPVYSWGVPPVVLDAISRLPIAPGSRHHLVATCGDDSGLTDRMFRRAIAARSASSGVVATVIMPNNYVTFPGFNIDSPELAASKLAAVPARIAEVASLITAGSADTSVTRGSFPRFKTSVIYPWFVDHAMSPRPFRTTDTCTSCGLCASTCPTRNIAMTLPPGADAAAAARPRPSWGDNCAFCLRCYHICPHHAIAHGRTTRSKGQYLNPTLFANLKWLKKS